MHNVHHYAFLHVPGREAADFRFFSPFSLRARRLVGTAERTRPPQAAAECAGAVRTDAPGAPLTLWKRKWAASSLRSAFAMKRNKPVRIPLLRDRALAFSPRGPWALLARIPKNTMQTGGGAAGGVWGGMPPRPQSVVCDGAISGIPEFFANLRRVRDSNPWWVAPHTLSKRAH